jgi:hypothetical protein
MSAYVQTRQPSTLKWTVGHTFGVLGMLAAIALLGFLMPVEQVRLTWLLTMAALALFVMIAAHGITGVRWLGWLIDEQYTMSLSRLQMFLWTIVVLSGFLTAVFVNIKIGFYSSAVNIRIPEEVWLVMGISTTSLVGASLILDKKRKETPNEQAVETQENNGRPAQPGGPECKSSSKGPGAAKPLHRQAL